MTFEYFINKESDAINQIINHLKEKRIVERIWEKDFTVWSDNPDEITNRLGWLDCDSITRNSFDEIYNFVDEIKKIGVKKALLLGMGGSSLAPEVFSLVFGNQNSFLELSVVDSTHPELILSKTAQFDPSETLYIVSTKSGGTVETISFMKFFYTYAVKKLGAKKASEHFVAITDHGSGLEQIAKELNFRKIFLNDPNIGGRFSALSLFGIVPAALVGTDIKKLFNRAEEEILLSKKSADQITLNHSAIFGVIVGMLAKSGKDKLTIITSERIKSFGSWVEQLIAESTGKIGKGILPVDLEDLLTPEYYSNDRVFVYLKLKAELSDQVKIDALRNSGFPVIEFELDDIYDLGKQFFLWEFATAIAGYILGIQPFDQPNVEQAKVIARNIIKDYQDKGKLSIPDPILVDGNLKVYSELKINSIKNALVEFLSDCKAGKNYVALQAYINPTNENYNLLQQLRSEIQKKYKVATTLGFGPRFLHSTGQLHKGDSGNGYFIQFISDAKNDLAIPDKAGEEKSSITFGVLIKAQALGDRQALIDNKRKVISFEFEDNINELLKSFTI